MSTPIFFVQQCPTCGRRLRVCVEYLGKKIQCRHCRGTLVARDPEDDLSWEDAPSPLTGRVEELLVVSGVSGAARHG